MPCSSQRSSASCSMLNIAQSLFTVRNIMRIFACNQHAHVVFVFRIDCSRKNIPWCRRTYLSGTFCHSHHISSSLPLLRRRQLKNSLFLISLSCVLLAIVLNAWTDTWHLSNIAVKDSSKYRCRRSKTQYLRYQNDSCYFIFQENITKTRALQMSSTTMCALWF